MPGVEPSRADRRYADQPVKLGADPGKRRLDGGPGRIRAQLSGQIPAFRGADGLSGRNCVKLPLC